MFNRNSKHTWNWVSCIPPSLVKLLRLSQPTHMLKFIRNTCPQLHTIISTNKNIIKSLIPTKQLGQAHFSEVNMIISDFRLTSVVLLVLFTTSRWSLARGHRVDTTFGPMEFETRCGDLVSILVASLQNLPVNDRKKVKWSCVVTVYYCGSGYIYYIYIYSVAWFCCFPYIYNWVVVGFLTLLGTRVHHARGFVQYDMFQVQAVYRSHTIHGTKMYIYLHITIIINHSR